MKNKVFQSGGPIVDEDELFEDASLIAGRSGESPSALSGELLDQGAADLENGPDPLGYVAPLNKEEEEEEEEDALDTSLTGVEQFLTAYGVQGGVITYEDGSSARFSDLSSEEQTEILTSLVSESIPSVEEKYNLDEDEVNLLNTLRDSDMTSEEFINSLVDYRMQALSAQRELSTTDYETVSDDAIFIKSLRDSYPDMEDEELAEELSKAKDLASYENTVDNMRKLFMTEQANDNYILDQEQDALFNQELEAQRHEIVATVEDINDIGGANITSEMKEYLLHDIMELNENKDPILMEKLFESPEAMFKANWFLNYGEDYMKETNNYWRNEVSKARKEGYLQATNGMPGNPVNIGGVLKGKSKSSQASFSDGKELSEEELFEEREY